MTLRYRNIGGRVVVQLFPKSQQPAAPQQTVVSYFRAVPVRTECCRWTVYHRQLPATMAFPCHGHFPLFPYLLRPARCYVRPTASALSHAEQARVSRLRAVHHHFSPFFSFPLLSCFSFLHESVRLCLRAKQVREEWKVTVAWKCQGCR